MSQNDRLKPVIDILKLEKKRAEEQLKINGDKKTINKFNKLATAISLLERIEE